uniref:Endonuclease n=1 Tax=Sinocyclocheilus grahami TaxID=75366 RepID=A0A672L064_SINGR
MQSNKNISFYSVSQGQTGTPFQPGRQSSGNDPGTPDQSRTDGSAASERETGARKRRLHDTVYIRIPLTKMFGSKATSTSLKAERNWISDYKLIDRPPEQSKDETDEETEIKKNGFYVMLFNKDKNHAEWVYEILNKKTIPFYYEKPKFKDDRKDPDFKETKKRNQNYDRGHLAAAANHKWCQEAYEDTYLMSNITPQNKNLNRGAWKGLEIYCRDKILNSNVRNVHVYTGPLYLKKEEKSGKENVCKLDSSEIDYEDEKALPTHYFKVLIVENMDGNVSELECFWILNDKEKMYEQVNIEEIERLSGLMGKQYTQKPQHCLKSIHCGSLMKCF